MRNRFQRIHCIFHFLGKLLEVLGVILLLPVAVVFIYWGRSGEGWLTVVAFVGPALASFSLGFVFRNVFTHHRIDMTTSMLLCALSWLVASALGALPFTIGISSSYLDGYFEAMSGFTTTGITMFDGLDNMPRSILFWRALTQWLGGLGILSFFLAVTFRGEDAHHLFGAESHKIFTRRPAPGLFNTVKILWKIYGLFTVLSITVLSLEGMPVFDAICHTFTALSTGGYSPHDASIGYYALTGHPNFRLIEYTLVVIMMLGGISFLVHFRVLTRDIKALWDTIEIRYWWGMIAAFVVFIMIDHFINFGQAAAYSPGGKINFAALEQTFRHTLFQVVSILTTTGFATRDIRADFFPPMSKQLFLIMMVIGACVGSTGGGIKVLRVAILNRLMRRELFRSRVSWRASTALVIDKKVIPVDEIHRVSALFFTWIVLLVIGGAITAIFSKHSGWESFSGMCSALGNIGPCYIPAANMITLAPAVKITYVFGMLVGRLEILPVLLLFSRKVWR